MSTVPIDEDTSIAAIPELCEYPAHLTEQTRASSPADSGHSTELASSVQQRVVWQEQIRGRLDHLETGDVRSLHLTMFPMEGGHSFAERMRESLRKHSTVDDDEDAIEPGDSCSNCSTPLPRHPIEPSGLALNTDPTTGSGRGSVGPVVLPPKDYSSPSGCHTALLSLTIAGRVLKVRASEIARHGGFIFPLLVNEDGSLFIGDIDLPLGYDYNCPEDCKSAARWLELAASVMKQRADTLCRGDSMPPVSNRCVDLGLEEQLFGEPPQETSVMKTRKRPQSAASAGQAKRPRWR